MPLCDRVLTAQITMPGDLHAKLHTRRSDRQSVHMAPRSGVSFRLTTSWGKQPVLALTPGRDGPEVGRNANYPASKIAHSLTQKLTVATDFLRCAGDSQRKVPSLRTVCQPTPSCQVRWMSALPLHPGQ